MMHIHWMLPGKVDNIETLLKSNLASVRMRAGLFAKYCTASFTFSAGDNIAADSDVIVIGKIGADCNKGRSLHWKRQIANAYKQNKIIILDYTDHHLYLSESPMGAFYHWVIPFVHYAVVPSTKMKELLSTFFDGDIQIIADPIEVPIRPYREKNYTDIPVILWFGHFTNISYLIDYIGNIDLCDIGFELIVLSNDLGIKKFKSSCVDSRNLVQVHFKDWSIPEMIDSAQKSHACIIPSDPTDLRKSGASANRLITSLALGLPTFADRLSSYSEFKNYFNDIREVPISYLYQKENEFKDEIDCAQSEVVSMFTPEKIFDRWINYFHAFQSIKV